MKREERGAMPLPLRLGAIATLIAAIIMLLTGIDRETRRRVPPAPPLVAVRAPDEPIAAEAQVFRRNPAELATDPRGTRRGTAHPRTLATYRALRAYPGAPPRIPHGLTTDEVRTGRCGTCHARGGYSARFEAYAPVTPHPELPDCLQCHVADWSLAGLGLPAPDPDGACRQCHVPGGRRAPRAPPRWRAATWPEVPQRVEPGGAPPPIPHDLQMRGNCLACHVGPAAVAEIRTTHPERVDCRQCHVLAPPADNGSMPTAAGVADDVGGRPGGDR